MPLLNKPFTTLDSALALERVTNSLLSVQEALILPVLFGPRLLYAHQAGLIWITIWELLLEKRWDSKIRLVPAGVLVIAVRHSGYYLVNGYMCNRWNSLLRLR